MKRLLILLSLAVVLPVFGQPAPKLTNAQVQTVSASGGLQKTIANQVSKSNDIVWIGYAVPTQSSSRFICCCDNSRGFENRGSCSGGCRLENEH
jgi:hypothetical protein